MARVEIIGAILATAGILLLGSVRPSHAVEMTDTALVLAVDVSESVTPERYTLQMEGIARAFHDRDVQGGILSGAHHSMFVTLVEWSNRPFVVLPWTLITSAEDADAVADKIRAAPRADNQFTCMSRALRHHRRQGPAVPPGAGRATVIDVSGDGRDNSTRRNRSTRYVTSSSPLAPRSMGCRSSKATRRRRSKPGIATMSSAAMPRSWCRRMVSPMCSAPCVRNSSSRSAPTTDRGGGGQGGSAACKARA